MLHSASPLRRRLHVARVVALSSLLAAAACGGDSSRQPPPVPQPSTVQAPAPEPPVVAPGLEANRPRVVVLGDSLTAGYGLPSQDQSFPAVLQQKVDEARLPYEVVNMGVSGDTTAGGLRRLDWALDGDVQGAGRRAGRQRRLARPRSRPDAREPVGDRRWRDAQGRAGPALRHGGAAQPRAATTRAQFRAVYGELARDKNVVLPPVPARRRGRPARVQSTRRHPSQRGRCPARRRRSSGPSCARC